jgi:hypothetical protein
MNSNLLPMLALVRAQEMSRRAASAHHVNRSRRRKRR